MQKRVIYFLYIACLFYMVACGSNDEPGVTPTTTTPTINCSGVMVSYTAEVSPLISANCATSIACHSTGSANGPGPLTNYAQVFSNRVAISTAVRNGIMPKDHTLSADQKSKIVCWIENGAASN